MEDNNSPKKSTFPISFVTSKGNTVSIRYPEESDLEQVVTYANELVYEDTYITLTGELKTHKEEQEWLSKIINDINKKKSISLFAFIDETLVGNCTLELGGPRREHIGLLGISIKAVHRDEGIGRKLIEVLLEEGKNIGMTIVELYVYGENERAKHLYESLGFIVCGNLPQSVRYKDRMLDYTWMYKRLD